MDPSKYLSIAVYPYFFSLEIISFATIFEEFRAKGIPPPGGIALKGGGNVFVLNSKQMHACDRQTNDELRQNFIDKTVGQAEVIGLKIPDPDLKWNEERGHYDFGEMNWEEFWNVVNGHGPCNKQRLAHHKRAHDNGKWVRDASQAYAQKQEKILKS